jgi:hypothetical protein
MLFLKHLGDETAECSGFTSYKAYSHIFGFSCRRCYNGLAARLPEYWPATEFENKATGRTTIVAIISPRGVHKAFELEFVATKADAIILYG